MATTQQLTATINRSTGTEDVTTVADWSSDNEAIATVSATGLVTAVAEGSATITATIDGMSDTSAITVGP